MFVHCATCTQYKAYLHPIERGKANFVGAATSKHKSKTPNCPSIHPFIEWWEGDGIEVREIVLLRPLMLARGGTLEITPPQRINETSMIKTARWGFDACRGWLVGSVENSKQLMLVAEKHLFKSVLFGMKTSTLSLISVAAFEVTCAMQFSQLYYQLHGVSSKRASGFGKRTCFSNDRQEDDTMTIGNAFIPCGFGWTEGVGG
ncbi:hypothetical protein T10_1949 [Trichinella papuae]|uniref:Uncharacterized protein n=1 Tax=Trichinella papuae TaxID=268474 RepID=A0A0V1M9Z6_9BILA|nr:hypothetical protein T10_1949 [Trichinella papuae]